jgi:peptidoglycan-associated lipoprotein
MFTRAFFTTLMVGLLAIGCASNKPKNAQDGAANGADAAGNNGLSLELNGDSDNGKAGGLKTVFFGFDSSSIDADTKAAVQANADYLKANANVDVQVEGHCDERGGRQYNLALGERRAKAVRDTLVALGVEAKRISTISYGNERPKAEGNDESAWSQNRRANFVVTAK